MPTVTVSEKTRNYLDNLRKNAPLDKVPNVKKTFELVLEFIENNEEAFFNYLGKQENGLKNMNKKTLKVKKG